MLHILHGGDLSRAARDYGIEKWKWLDLSTGINPNGYEIGEISKSSFQLLPEPDDLNQLEEIARSAYGVPKSTGLIASPGSEFLIQALPQLRVKSRVAIVSPTFTSHEAAWRRYGHDVRQIADISEVNDESIVVVVNPNNPDGRVYNPKKLKKLALKLHEQGGYLVIDEAFADVVPGASFVPSLEGSNVIVLRSVGKFYGLAGVRLGFAIGPNRVLGELRDLMGDWAVSGPAIEIGIKALQDKAWAEQNLSILKTQSQKHRDVFEQRGVKVVGGTLLFNLIEIDDARTLHHQLAKRAVWTRPFEYNPRWLRIGLCKTQADLKRFNSLFSEAMSAGEVAA